VRDVFALSALDNSVAPSVPILSSVLGVNKMKQQVSLYRRDRSIAHCFLLTVAERV
jgi:hypothetical protein